MQEIKNITITISGKQGAGKTIIATLIFHQLSRMFFPGVVKSGAGLEDIMSPEHARAAARGLGFKCVVETKDSPEEELEEQNGTKN